MRLYHWLSHTSLFFVRKFVVAVVGGSVLVIGIVMIVTPGPACLVIPAGLAILAVEFAWARRLLTWAKDYFRRQKAEGGKKAA